MKQHFQKNKPSITDMSYEEKRALHIKIRQSRLIPKIIQRKSTAMSKEAKAKAKIERNNKKINKLISEMSVKELEQLENILKNRRK